jgi:hypothetical protein
MDLLDYFRGVYPWGKLYRLLDQLPKWSRYKLALADDDELADLAHAAAGDGGRGGRPRLSDWDPVEELRAEIRDGVGRIEAAIANSQRPKGKNPIRPKPSPRPMTAAQRAVRRADYATHQDIVSRVLPKG